MAELSSTLLPWQHLTLALQLRLLKINSPFATCWLFNHMCLLLAPIYVFTWAAAKTPVLHGQINLSADLLIYHQPLIINLPRLGCAQELLKKTTRCCFTGPRYQPDVQQVTTWTSGRRARSILLIRLENVNGGCDFQMWLDAWNKQQAGSGQASPTGSLRIPQFQTPVVPSQVHSTAKSFNSYVISAAGPQY